MKAKIKKQVISAVLIPGKDYYLYAPGGTVEAVVSPEKKNIPLLGGFHTLCADVGIIPGHPLSGYVAGDILPQSIWNLHHRARSENNDGLVFDPKTNIWVDIYLASGIGKNTASIFGGNISNNRSLKDFIADMEQTKKRLLTHDEFTSAAEGSNEMTNIKDSTFPVSTGGHIDTIGRRMISHIGCEDMCGVVWQWLSTLDLADPEYQLIAGGSWSNAATAGSRCRNANNCRWNTNSNIGARFAAEPL